MSGIETAGEWPTEAAIERILSATSSHEAAGIRNQVSMAAMYRRRPQADAEACQEAFSVRWGREVIDQKLGPIGPLHYTGD
jgi:hypothetical protein